MAIQTPALTETASLTDFLIPAPRAAEPVVTVRPTVHVVETPVETRVETAAATSPDQRPRALALSMATLGVVLVLVGCVGAASFLVVDGPALPLMAVVAILFGLALVGQAAGRRPSSGETYDIR